LSRSGLQNPRFSRAVCFWIIHAIQSIDSSRYVWRMRLRSEILETSDARIRL
jgi:hypothetical protein